MKRRLWWSLGVAGGDVHADQREDGVDERASERADGRSQK